MALLADAYYAAGCVDDALGMVEVGLAMSGLLGQPFCDTELLGREVERSLRRAVTATPSRLSSRARGRAAPRSPSATLRTAVAFTPHVARDNPIAHGCPA